MPHKRLNVSNYNLARLRPFAPISVNIVGVVMFPTGEKFQDCRSSSFELSWYTFLQLKRQHFKVLRDDGKNYYETMNFCFANNIFQSSEEDNKELEFEF